MTDVPRVHGIRSDRVRARALFTPRGLRALADFAASNVLVAFDYDGTLAPIVVDPACASLRPRTRRLLRSLSVHYPVAVVSGRREADVVRRLRGTCVWVAAGPHTRWLKQETDPRRTQARVAAWRQSLHRLLKAVPDVQVEDKQFALAIHYRRVGDPHDALSSITAATQALTGARVVFGERFVNVLPVEAMSKLAVLTRIRRHFGCDAAIYVGDDTGDEDVFAVSGTTPLLPIRVGQSQDTAARYFLEGQRDVDTLIEKLLDLRRENREPPFSP